MKRVLFVFRLVFHYSQISHVISLLYGKILQLWVILSARFSQQRNSTSCKVQRTAQAISLETKSTCSGSFCYLPWHFIPSDSLRWCVYVCFDCNSAVSMQASIMCTSSCKCVGCWNSDSASKIRAEKTTGQVNERWVCWVYEMIPPHIPVRKWVGNWTFIAMLKEQ